MTGHDDTKSVLRVVAAATFLALPVAFVFGLVLRQVLAKPDFASTFGPFASLVSALAWFSFLITCVCAPVAWRVFNRLRLRKIKGASIVAFAAAASVVQVPALLASLTLPFGADIMPATLAVLTGSAFIFSCYLRAARAAG